MKYYIKAGGISKIGNYIKSISLLDPDAKAFLTAASITDPTQTSAVNQLVVDMKTANIWTKMKAIYPFVGGTATTHKWNLKDPQDTNAAFRLVFNGGWTHSANGVQANGINGYADTFLNSLNHLEVDESTIGVYTRKSTTPLGSAYGGVNSSFVGNALIIRFSGDGKCYFASNDNQGAGSFATSSTGLEGLWTVTIDTNSLGVKRIYKNQTIINATNRLSTTLNNQNIVFSARNVNGTVGSYDDSEYSFFYISYNLTSSEISDFYTAIQTFQTTLGRNV